MREDMQLTSQEIIARLESLADEKNAEGMRRYGISGSRILGIRIPVLRALARETGRKNHSLAQELWDYTIHEARILATMIDDPGQVDESLMETRVRDFDSWDLCDQCIMNLFEKTLHAWTKAFEWADREEEFIRRAGFVLMARLAVSDKQAPDDRFTPFFPVMVKYANDKRNFVKKAINWALRQIGKRNVILHEHAIACAYEILTLNTPTARWIARDALRELESDAVKKRLKMS